MINNNGSVVTDGNRLSSTNKKKSKKTDYANLVNKKY